MTSEVAFTADAEAIARAHLLQHYRRGCAQEDLCFALWRPSTGRTRRTALIDEILLPIPGDRRLHGNASFQPSYLMRALQGARTTGAGLALMHSHPTPGWQDMSSPDVAAERDALAYPAGATGLPFVGMTIGTDGFWSARFWRRDGRAMRRHWCPKVRIVGPATYTVFHNDNMIPPPQRRRALRRTFDTWGPETQNMIARLTVGIVGLGSVGSIVAEAVARMGIGRVLLVDPDYVEEHNLDRLMFATSLDIGKPKVSLAAAAMRQHATARPFEVLEMPASIHDKDAYASALDCDVIFSCVDRPIARDVLNYIAHAHLIPVVDGGVAVEYQRDLARLLAAHWRAHLITPYHRCLRCNGQYSSGMVVVELDGSLDDPSYVSGLPADPLPGNQNVFPFSLSAAALVIGLMLRYLISADWWPAIPQQDYQFVTGDLRVIDERCHPFCSFRGRRALGDKEAPPYLTSVRRTQQPAWRRAWQRLKRLVGT